MSGRFGIVCSAGSLTLPEARSALCAFILSAQQSKDCVFLAPPSEALRWLALDCPEITDDPSAQLKSLFDQELLYASEASPPCYRLALEKLPALSYRTHEQRALLPIVKDPIVADEEKRPTDAFTMASRALSARVSDIVLESEADPFGVLLCALCALSQREPPQLTRVASLEDPYSLPTIDALRREGFLEQAIRNALCLLDWAPSEGSLVLSWELLVLLYAPVEPGAKVFFDLARLRSLNEAHLRALSFDELGRTLRPFLEEAGLWRPEHNEQRWARLAREEISTLSEVSRLSFLSNQEHAGPSYAASEARAALQDLSARAVLTCAAKYFTDGGEDFYALRSIIEEQTSARRKKLFYPLRAALTGQIFGPPLPEIIPFLGAKECSARVSLWQAWLAQQTS